MVQFIDKELSKDDWSGLVVHFPGLDHLAHMGGAYSPYMHSKQQEMDEVVQKVYRSIETEPHLDKTLFVLLGDHGMDDLGQHGGDSVEELSTALLFISPRLQALPRARDAPKSLGNPYSYFGSVHQFDLVPTISGLLGLPVPRNNLGGFIPDLLPLWKETGARRSLIRQNLFQLGHGAGQQKNEAATQDYQADIQTHAFALNRLQGNASLVPQAPQLADEISLLSQVSINPDM
jgi:ethanolaminephosphotransferase